MKRRIISGLALGSFIIFSFACVSVREVKREALTSADAEKLEIAKIIKTSGDTIVFFEKKGKISGDAILGYGAVESTVTKSEIPIAQVKAIKYFVNALGDKEIFVTTKDDKTFPVLKIIEMPEAMEMWIRNDIRPPQFKSMSVALSEIEKVYGRMFDLKMTIQGIIIPAALVGLVLYIIDKIKFGGILG